MRTFHFHTWKQWAGKTCLPNICSKGCQKNLGHLGQYFCPRDEDITAKAVFSYCQWLTSLSGNYYTVSGTYQLFLAACLSGSSGCMIYLNTTCGLPLLLRITSLANRILSMIKRVPPQHTHHQPQIPNYPFNNCSKKESIKICVTS